MISEVEKIKKGGEEGYLFPPSPLPVKKNYYLHTGQEKKKKKPKSQPNRMRKQTGGKIADRLPIASAYRENNL